MGKKEFLHEFTKQVILTAAKRKRTGEMEKIPAERIQIIRVFPGMEEAPPQLIRSVQIIKPQQIVQQPVQPAAKPLPTVSAPAISSVFPMDIGKLNPLISDSSVSMIECFGSKSKLRIKKDSSVSESEVILDENDIKSVITKFSEASKEKITEPVFKTAFGGWELTAIVSDIVGSRFVIKRSSRKMLPEISVQ